MEEKNFLDELIEESIQKEEANLMVYCDLLMIEAIKIESEIQKRFKECRQEIAYIEEWTLKKNAHLQEKYDRIVQKLELIMRETQKKTIELPHGTMKIRKMPDRVEITDLEAFIKNATEEMVVIIPEKLKPDLNKIKQYIKKTSHIPEGVTYIEGSEEFKLKLNKEANNDTESKIGTAD